MSGRSRRACAVRLAALALGAWGVAAVADPAPACTRLTGDTLACNALPADHAPVNTERAAPSAPPSDALVMQRLAVAVATLPEAPPVRAVELNDTADRANFPSGSDELTAAATADLNAFVASLKDVRVLRVLVSAHTDSQRLVHAARRRFGSNQHLSEARAARIVAYLEAALDLPESAFAIQGFGDSRPVASNKTLKGRARNRRAEIKVWSETLAPAPPVTPTAPAAPASVERLDATSGCIGDQPGQLPAVRITVDGVPLDRREGTNEADRQRCVDVALARAEVQVRYDPLEQAPFLNAVAIEQPAVAGRPVRFATYSNYARFIARAELRVFSADESVQQAPLAVIAATVGAGVEWTPPVERSPLLRLTARLGKPRYLTYVLRVYDAKGRFDETKPRRLDLADTPPVATPDARRRELELERSAYGENTLLIHNIPVHGGAVTVSGGHVPPDDSVVVLGLPVPVDDQRHFVIRQILPGGPQQVTVAITNARGEGLEFTRNLSIATDDALFVALADFTAGRGSVGGPVDLVSGDPGLGRRDYANGELAFYYKGLVKGEWLLTAAADTQQQPLRDLFSNFASKDPEVLLRRIDPDRYYPVYGDDSTTVQDAPTSGKFYVRLEKDGTSVMWGDFQAALSGTEFIQYTRTLYGLDLRYRSPETTAYGEKRRSADAFWATPGTLESRQEFRGTGGSLFYLQYQDVAVGSEQVSVQVRDKDSGLVVAVTPLVPAQDYDINYMQGRILLHDALAATANAATVVHSGGLDGDPQYLVVTYEYVPGFQQVNSLAIGGHASEWFGDHFQLGLSDYHQGDPGEQQDLRGADATWRYAAGTYVKTEFAHSDGPGSPTLTSITGGLSFNALTTAGGPANAERVEAAVDLAEVTDSMTGRVRFYESDRGANFSGPGELTPGVGVRQQGAAVSVPLDPATQVTGKLDNTDSTAASVKSGEFGVEHKLDESWRVAVGMRVDDRDNALPNASPILSQNGSRTDVAVTIGYQPAVASAPATAATAAGGPPTAAGGKPVAPKPPWDVYGFVQGTAERTDTRPENDRTGFGGSYQLSSAVRAGAEVSDGSLGVGGKLSTDYRIDERSNLYLNYTLAADQPDALNVGRAGTLTSGTRYAYNDTTSMYAEDRMQTGTGPTGLTNAYGVDFAPSKQWTYGLKLERGTVSDPLAGDQSLSAVGATLGYTLGRIKYAAALEWRDNDSSIYGASRTELMRNSLSYQLVADWRLFGKLNWSQTDGEASSSLNAEYREFVLGAAWRPTHDDRWNTLFKFTLLTDEPSTAQIAAPGNTIDYAQQSRVVDVDTTYQATNWLAVGAKYAVRTGELRPTETVGEWFASRAQLLVLRGDLLFTRQWDALLELRQLSIHETDDQRTGMLLGAYRHLGDNLKIGAGYNFTDYSDNLTDVGYRSHGFFLNTIGKF
jgi:outer membrane protein OmpA-like peptidoglycan-associated protein